MELAKRTALVTGAGHRVGQAIALALGARQMRVAVHYNAADAGARETARLIEYAGGSAAIFGADLTQPDAPAKLVDAVTGRFGTLDVLVNSAAVMWRTPFGEVTPDTWDRIMALNLRAPFLLTQAAAPHLRAAHGAVINIADLAALETWPAYVPHGISKSGVVFMTRSLARVMAPEVRVCAIAPGAVLLPDDWSDDDAERLEATTPLRRLGSPEDVSSAVVFLLESDYITGETLVVDGGRNVR
jgi:pteridine reductase